MLSLAPETVLPLIDTLFQQIREPRLPPTPLVDLRCATVDGSPPLVRIIPPEGDSLLPSADHRATRLPPCSSTSPRASPIAARSGGRRSTPRCARLERCLTRPRWRKRAIPSTRSSCCWMSTARSLFPFTLLLSPSPPYST